jgi:formamidopyrimidine-DNA glycosylase
MPELPDVVVYIEALERRVLGQTLNAVRLVSPFVLRTAVPPISSAAGKRIRNVRRIGKRIVLELEDELFLVLHLMIAGRLRWLVPPAKPPGRITLAVLELENGWLVFTEAGTKRRASLHLIRGEEALRALDPGGIDVFRGDAATFDTRIKSANHTLKRALTDPRLFSGIGNAYSDEILHRAQLSPFAMTKQLSDQDIAKLHDAVRVTLGEWTDHLRREAAGDFPERVTAFRDGMAAHGRYGKPCPVCGAPIQRIVYAENETNYCARCQTGGKILADRALSRLLHKSWPKNIDELD